MQVQNGELFGREADTKDLCVCDKMLKVEKPPDTSISQAVCVKLFNANQCV